MSKIEYPKESKLFHSRFERYVELKLENHPEVMEQLAIEFNVAIKTLYNQSSNYKWKERLEVEEDKANAKAMKKVQRRMEKANIESLNKLLDNMKEVENNVFGSLDGAYSVSDYEKLYKLKRLVQGESTENTTSNNISEIKLTDEDKKYAEELSEKIEENEFGDIEI